MAVICFDFDGTLGDTLGLEEKYYLPACKKLGIMLFPTMDSLKEACRINYYEYCRERGLSAEVIRRLGDEYRAALEQSGEKASLFNGAAGMLKELISRHTVYVVSLNNERFMKERFEEAGVSGFAGIVGSETSTDKVSTLRKLRAAYPDEDFYFVSDSVGDMGEALEAGVPHILAVSYGWGLKEDLKESGAHAVFDSVEELSAFLQSVP